MKKLFIILIGGLLFACKPVNPNQSCLPEGWSPMPEEKIKSFFQNNENDIVTYISENGETLSFKCELPSYNYHSYCENEIGEEDPEAGESKFLHYEEHSSYITFKCSSNSARLSYSLAVWANRTRLTIHYSYRIGDNDNYGVLEREFKKDDSKDKGMGYPKNPNEFIPFLTDTIELRRIDTNELTGILVSGKGLAWFKDHEGVKWTLQ
ncbi:MAG: hypothetical protein LBS50_10150 [Prevotellaceae bacterium]|jgi:hypothetical protein|nr:hypothetical protein [Prevotellaceae bacterium]